MKRARNGMKRFLVLCLLFYSALMAHEGHTPLLDTSSHEGMPKNWTQWIGGFHLVFLQFPLALVNMVALAEILFACLRRPLFEAASRFMLASAAFFAPLTALLGIIYSYSGDYEGWMESFLAWHMWLGLATAFLAVIAALIKCYHGCDRLYFAFLLLLVALVNMTGFFGGGMTFGPLHLYPPVFSYG